MPKRFDFTPFRDRLAPLLELSAAARRDALADGLGELVMMRASQLNGCAYCLDMHSKDARAAGETEQRLYLLQTWREAPCYSERERAALAWTEALTRFDERGVDEEALEAVREHFDDSSLMDLTLAVIAINGWNRLAVGFGTDVGSYRPPHRGPRKEATEPSAV